MRSETIFTRKPAGLDYRVWLTAFIISVISIALLGFKMSGNVQCHTVMITVKTPLGQPENTYYIGERLAFKADMAKSKTVSWDFGDGTESASGMETVHAFKKEGSYIVSVTVNGKCTESITLFVRQLVNVQIATAPTDASPIFGPDAPVAGEPVRYTAAGTAQSYEWTVLNSPDFPVQTEPSATYIFPTPGTRVIEVKLDGDPAKTFRKEITILPGSKVADVSAPVTGGTVPPPVIAPPPVRDVPTTPDAPATTVIPDEEFKNMLDAVTKGNKDASSFGSVLCTGAQTKVLVNGSDWQTFGELCSRIHDNKKYVIKGVQAVRNEKNCVTLLKVDYKKKGLLGL